MCVTGRLVRFLSDLYHLCFTCQRADASRQLVRRNPGTCGTPVQTQTRVMDKSSEQFGFIKDGQIGVRLFKGMKNHNWLVNKVGNTGVSKKKLKTGVAVAKKDAPKSKPSLPVSIPIQIYWDAMQNRKNAEFKVPNLDRVGARRRIAPPSSPTKTPTTPPLPSSSAKIPPPLPSSSTLRAPSSSSRLTMPPPQPFISASGFRMVRHPVPTSKPRTTMADKTDPLIRNPQPITTKKNTITILPKNLPPAEAPHKGPEENETATNRTVNITEPYVPHQRDNISMRHKLPIAVVSAKTYNANRLSTPVTTESELNNTQIPLTLEATTQTNQIFIVTEDEAKILQKIKSRNITEDDFQILELLKNCDATKEEIGTQLDILKRQKESNGKNSEFIDLENYPMGNCGNSEVIDLENDSMASCDNSEVMKKCFKHSDTNKHLLLAALEAANHLQDVESALPSTARIPEESSPSTSARPPAAIKFEEMIRALGLLILLKNSGWGLASNNTQQTHTTGSNNRCTQTHYSNNNKKRKTSVNNHPVEMEVEPSAFQPTLLTGGQLQNLQKTGQVSQQTGLMYQQSQLRLPQMQISRLHAPQMQAYHPPQLQSPQFHSPQLQSPQFPPPQLQTPQFPSPQLQTPPLPPPQLQTTFPPSQLNQQLQITRLPPPPPPPPPPTPQLQQAQILPYVTQEQPVRPVQYYTPRLENTPRLSRVLSTREANQAIQESQAAPHPAYAYFYQEQDIWTPEQQ